MGIWLFLLFILGYVVGIVCAVIAFNPSKQRMDGYDDGYKDGYHSGWNDGSSGRDNKMR